MSSNHALSLEVGARSETGFVREENQDRMSRIETPLGQLFVVADGMGGHRGGALAAEKTVAALQESLASTSPGEAVEEAIRRAFAHANASVFSAGQNGDPTTAGMGSTAVLLLTVGKTAHLAHVGDSRAYLLRRRRLRRLTSDHTVVQRMVDAGLLSSDQVANHPDNGVLERAVGTRATVQVSVRAPLAMREGDVVMLCSDGLCGYLGDREIEQTLNDGATVQDVAARLVDLALNKGGEDNVTVQCIQYGERELSVPAQAFSLLRSRVAVAVSATVLGGVILLVAASSGLLLDPQEDGDPQAPAVAASIEPSSGTSEDTATDVASVDDEQAEDGQAVVTLENTPKAESESNPTARAEARAEAPDAQVAGSVDGAESNPSTTSSSEE